MYSSGGVGSDSGQIWAEARRWAANLVIKGLDLDGADVENAEVLDFLKLLDSAKPSGHEAIYRSPVPCFSLMRSPANGTTTRLVVKREWRNNACPNSPPNT
jgi:hypothetical protein